MDIKSSNSTKAKAVAVTCVVVIGATIAVLDLYKKRATAKKTLDDDVVEPPYVSSWIPHVGSALEMSKLGHLQFIQKYTQKCGTPIFSANIMGRLCHFIGDPLHTQFVFKDWPQFDTQSIAMDFLQKAMGCDKKEIDKAHASPGWIKQSKESFRNHILATQSIQETVQKAQSILLYLVDQISDGEHALFQLVKENIFLASVEPFVGKDMADTDYLAAFRDLDRGIPLAMANAPNVTQQKFIAAREMFVQLLQRESFQENCSPFMKERIRIGSQHGIQQETIARINLSLFWASVGNSAPAIFWTILFVLQDPIAYEQIQKEVDSLPPLSQNTNDGDEESLYSLENLDKCVLIDSAFKETLRLRAWPFAVKNLVDNVIFDPKQSDSPKFLLKSGTRIVGNQAVTYMDPDIFPNPQTFQYDRFVVNQETGQPPSFSKNGKTIAEPLRVFGGGKRLCPGRKFVACETKAYIAVLFRKFHMEIVGKHTFAMAEADKRTANVGVMHPVEDVMIKFTRR
ncbi:hydroxycholest-4-en-3-one 12-alpha-hydroxylase [Seminavis robusta]|uniref:Hydroxycholest-4-en-3-one 12-alpha-hydroxylase n=1 Tax=Seminavis robusta TaxID=568900 RepID=A0A9N8DZ26_9STRA|nr:hydroxycholest-4-en-3-one 12-alpha-hydroxylase [Seminavis robusta]|eukprot:Sro490_g153460.1 hydroxycholest-4-en-3-one 12-alpha-hydroxylase (512) ;mRNA; f:7791-9326